MCSAEDEGVEIGFELVDSIAHTCRVMRTLSAIMVGMEDTSGFEVTLRYMWSRLGQLLDELEKEREEKEKGTADET